MASYRYKGFTLWFTGLSGSGKSTLAHLVSLELKDHGVKTEILDEETIRVNLSKGLSATREDMSINVRRIGFVCKLLTRNDIVAIAAAISPYRDIRYENRVMIGNFIEVYLKCDLKVCEARDPKGLYKKARAGLIKNFTGISDPYEPPHWPDVTCFTDKETPEECLDRIMKKIIEFGYIEFINHDM